MKKLNHMAPVSALALTLPLLSFAVGPNKPKVSYFNYHRSHGKVWETKAQVPQVSGVLDAAQLNRLNRAYEIDSCRKWVQGSGKIANTWTHTVNAFERQVRSIYVYPRLQSYMSGVFWDTGGAHPGYYFDGRNVWREGSSWHSIKTSRFFKKGYAWAKELNSILYPILKDKGAAFLWDGTVKSVPTEDFENVVVTSTGFRFYINPYDVGPWAQGQFIATVTFNQVQGLDPNGPLKGILPASYK